MLGGRGALMAMLLLESCKQSLLGLVFMALTAVLLGCSAPPELTGFAVNTPRTYSENKVFFVQRLEGDKQFESELVAFEHLYQINPEDKNGNRREDIIEHNDPVSVVLQGVRIPEDIGPGTRDIAVVLDIETSTGRGTTTFVAFYQRDVPAGQMLNFNNLLVYADPQWDSKHAPYFRIRVLDVKAERNRRTAALLDQVSNISASIGGTIPHPVIPLVQTAIDAAGLVLSNQQNSVILDYQIQFYGADQRKAAGGATLGPLVSGQWVVLGRGRGADSGFWREPYMLDRQTDQIQRKDFVKSDDGTCSEQMINVPIPYVSIVLIKADAEVPKLVLDRSQALLELLSTPGGKSDLDMLEFSSQNLGRSIEAFMTERRLRRYRSMSDVQVLIQQLSDHETANTANGDPQNKLNNHELQRLLYVLRAITPQKEHQQSIPDWIEWWNKDVNGLQNWETFYLAEEPSAPLGIMLKIKDP